MATENKSTVDKYGFGKLDTWLIDTYLRHKDETLEEAKARIAAENNRKKAENLQKNSTDAEIQTKL